jgi:Mrp family chromosome partitioning ATPase
MVDTAILVVKAGHTPFHLVERTIDAIGRDRILGVVLNGADERQLTNAYYGYRTYGSAY